MCIIKHPSISVLVGVILVLFISVSSVRGDCWPIEKTLECTILVSTAFTSYNVSRVEAASRQCDETLGDDCRRPGYRIHWRDGFKDEDDWICHCDEKATRVWVYYNCPYWKEEECNYQENPSSCDGCRVSSRITPAKTSEPIILSPALCGSHVFLFARFDNTGNNELTKKMKLKDGSAPECPRTTTSTTTTTTEASADAPEKVDSAGLGFNIDALAWSLFALVLVAVALFIYFCIIRKPKPKSKMKDKAGGSKGKDSETGGGETEPGVAGQDADVVEGGYEEGAEEYYEGEEMYDDAYAEAGGYDEYGAVEDGYYAAEEYGGGGGGYEEEYNEEGYYDEPQHGQSGQY